MAKQKKSTKTFLKKHLKGEMERRKVFKKKRLQHSGPFKGDLRKSSHAHDNEGGDDDDEEETVSNRPKPKLETLNVDEFMNAMDDLSAEDDDEDDEDEEEIGEDIDEDNHEDYEDDEDEDEDDDDDDDIKGVTTLKDIKDALSRDRAVKESKKKTGDLKRQVVDHKKQLDSLKEKDPEFHKFLEENEPKLLEFGEDLDDVSDDEMQEEELDEETEMDSDDKPARKEKAHKTKVLTKEKVDSWATALKKTKSIKVIRYALVAYKTACHLYDSNNDNSSDHLKDKEVSKKKVKKNNRNNRSSSIYSIDSPLVYNAVISLGLKQVVNAMYHHLGHHAQEETPAEKSASGASSSSSATYSKPKLISQHKNWSQFKLLVKSFVSNTLHLLRQLNEATMMSFVLQNVERAAMFFACFPKVSRALLKSLVEYWSGSEEHVRVMAFLCIRRLAIVCPFPFIDLCLKVIYLTFARSAKFTSVQNYALLTFMQNCVVEMYGIDIWSSYQHAFVYIRQLAIHLRNAIMLKKKEAFLNVYNWQVIHCLTVWARIISTYASRKNANLDQSQSSALAPLIYPLAQVLGGVIRLIPTAKYFPLRFHCVRALNMLSSETGVFIPVLPYLLEVLDSADMKKILKSSTTKPVDFYFTLKLSKTFIHTKAFQDAVLEAVLHLLLEHFSINAYSVSFPELALPAIVTLRKFVKNAEMPNTRKQIKQALDKIEDSVKYITTKRSSVGFSPKDLQQADSWSQQEETKNNSPIRKYFISWQKTEEQRRQKLIELHLGSIKDKERKSKDSDSDSSDDSDDEHESKRKSKNLKRHNADDESDDEEDEDEDEDEEDEDEDDSDGEEKNYQKRKGVQPSKAANGKGKFSAKKSDAKKGHETQQRKQRSEYAESDEDDIVEDFHL